MGINLSVGYLLQISGQRLQESFKMFSKNVRALFKFKSLWS